MNKAQKQLQAIVNAFSAHLHKQGKRSGQGSTCFYRSPDGLSCGLGGLISDEHYSPDLETLGAITPEVREALTKSGYPCKAVDPFILRELQYCHDKADDSNFIESFTDRLHEFCRRFGVDYPAHA